ncbi:hypothetical protein [Shewanella glacialimarina]|uniref:hypothetical protein n=1 Tax=Shewanella glacialimarina TaxID=2590884 RepID=UPI001CF82AE6|nr:hypothetical protein [Shewanella glacialimarina]UCX06174.1 hypothetical protein FJ709_17740 [Shewanella glacialimarina]
MRFLLVITFVFLMPTAHLIAATATQHTTQLTLSKKAINDNPSANLIYQQLFTMQSQLASLNEKLQQQKLLKSDIEQFETALQNLKLNWLVYKLK